MKSVLILGLQSARIDIVVHNALWVSRLDQVRNPRTPAPNCSVTDCDTFFSPASRESAWKSCSLTGLRRPFRGVRGLW